MIDKQKIGETVSASLILCFSAAVILDFQDCWTFTLRRAESGLLSFFPAALKETA